MVLKLGKTRKAEQANQMITFQKVLQVFKPWVNLITVNEEFKAVGNVQEKNDYSVEKKIQEEPQGTDANYHGQEERALANTGSDLKKQTEKMRVEKEK